MAWDPPRASSRSFWEMVPRSMEVTWGSTRAPCNLHHLAAAVDYKSALKGTHAWEALMAHGNLVARNNLSQPKHRSIIERKLSCDCNGYFSSLVVAEDSLQLHSPISRSTYSVETQQVADTRLHACKGAV